MLVSRIMSRKSNHNHLLPLPEADNHVIFLDSDEQEQEEDRVPPIRTPSFRHLSEDGHVRHKFHVGSDVLETLQRPVEMVMDTLRRITSQDNIHGRVNRSTSRVSFRDGSTPQLHRGKVSLDSRISIEDFKDDLADRATQLQKGVSYPCFEIFLGVSTNFAKQEGIKLFFTEKR